jgi:hypothetical protein
VIAILGIAAGRMIEPFGLLLGECGTKELLRAAGEKISDYV